MLLLANGQRCFLPGENSVNAEKKYGLKRLFSLLDGFAGILTCQFSGLTAAPFFAG
jgi:hypothetical protein